MDTEQIFPEYTKLLPSSQINLKIAEEDDCHVGCYGNHFTKIKKIENLHDIYNDCFYQN